MHSLYRIIKKLFAKIGDPRNASKESLLGRVSRKNSPLHTPPFSSEIDFEDEEEEEDEEEKEHTTNLLWDVFLGFVIDDEEEVVEEMVEEIHKNDYNLRSKRFSFASNSPSTSSPTTKNTFVSKSVATLDALNIEYNIVYDMKKTLRNISLYELSKLTWYKDLLLKALNDKRIFFFPVVSKGKSVAYLGKSQPLVIYTDIIGKKSSLMTLLFLMIFKIFNMSYITV